MIIQDFFKVIELNKNKNAFIFRKGKTLVFKTYQNVYDDIMKMANYFTSINILDKEILLFALPSYQFYIAMLTCIYLKIRIVVIDSFKNKEKAKNMLSLTNVDYIFTDKTTGVLKPFYGPVKGFKTIDITKYTSYSNTYVNEVEQNNKKVLVTFTSGTTGSGKLIERSIVNLERQFALVRKTIDTSKAQTVLSLLPIYVLANLLVGVTTYLIHGKFNNKKVKAEAPYLKKAKVNAVASSVSKYLAFRSPMPQIKYAYTGGSLISLRDAKRIKELFPNAVFTYVYGASEAVLMSKTNLDDYINNLQNNRICVGNIVEDINIKILNPNNSGIGEIGVSGKMVLSDNVYHSTGDLGYIENSKIYLLGRVVNSEYLNNLSYYSYDIENKILNRFEQIRKVVFVPMNKRYIVYEGNIAPHKVSKFLGDEFTVKQITKMPMDIRHNYKVDLSRVYKMLSQAGSQ